jgi:hypothetical protein
VKELPERTAATDNAIAAPKHKYPACVAQVGVKKIRLKKFHSSLF